MGYAAIQESFDGGDAGIAPPPLMANVALIVSGCSVRWQVSPLSCREMMFVLFAVLAAIAFVIGARCRNRDAGWR